LNNPETRYSDSGRLRKPGRIRQSGSVTMAKPALWHNFKDIIFLISLIIITIAVTYFTPRIFANIWYLLVLVLYSMSEKESLWLAFFLITVDGFMGFLGLYSITLTIIPGLPGVELAQFYVLIALFKAIRSKGKTYVFYNRYLQFILLYVIFMVLWGQISGFTGGLNAYFRVLKMVFPLSLFYAVPHLINDSKSYEKFFRYIFLIMIIAFAAQLISLLTGFEPASFVLRDEELFSEPGSFRGFYNAAVTLISMFGALFYLSLNKQTAFNKFFLYAVITASLGMAIISATRGWIIGFGIVIMIQLSVLLTAGKKEIPWLAVFLLLIFFTGMSNPKIKEQIIFSKERVMALSNLDEGDISAQRTLSRLNVRSPVVMKAWKEKPLFGWGFSDTLWKYGDGHVGNQNVLLLSGIAGFLILTGFLIYFSVKLLQRFIQSRKIHRANPAFLIFPVFLSGWFIIHSTSGQQFGFSGLPLHIIPQAVFFSFGAFVYRQSKISQDVKKI
jgi:hypothetical protein